MKKSEEYTRRIGEILASIGRYSLKTTQELVQISKLSQENDDNFLTERMAEALELKKQFDEIMIKIIDNLVRREDMR